MDNNEFDGNFEKIINQYTEASSTASAMDIDSDTDYNSKIHQMEREINHYKSKLRNCRDKYESMETKICNARRLQSKSLFALSNVQPMEEDLHERFKNIHLNYEACAEKSGGYEDLDETLRAKLSELTIQRNALMEELVQLRKNADDNNKKLARVKAMISDQEKKNAILLQDLKEKSENVVSISPDIKKRINTVLDNTSENKLKRRVIDTIKK
ncbi:laminin subunit beta-4 [Lasius niger]|uniref:Laminin subunit beta-4 n=1 Tax=Lasius niger TaxID=67767 RepID=A0A0J7L9P6_LASNI|nr:laminin subunit beta-4 [Lasius niger]